MNDKVKEPVGVHRISLRWSEIEILIEEVCKKIDSKKYTSIHGLPRGGLIPAVILSHKLKIPYTEKVTKGTLIVDDIIDSGNTLKKYGGYDKVVLIAIKGQEKKVISAGTIENKGQWFIFHIIGL